MRWIWFALLAAAPAWGQSTACSCGARAPTPPNRALEPYANAPEDLRPFSKFAKPYHEWYTKSPEYNGAARDLPSPAAADVSEVAIGFLGPVQDHKDKALGLSMLHGAELAVDEANARGGYGGKPFRLKVHNDGALWGASSNEIVKMVYDEGVWAMLGSISGDSTHIALRVSLRAELPIVNSAATDPTIPETIIPWILTTIQDDRMQGYTLARRIFTDLGLKRIALLRVNERYGRFGVLKFRDAARRLGHPVVIEQKFMPGDTDFQRQLRVIAASRVDGVVLWADANAAGMILQQMRAIGMKQPVFGSARVVGEDLFREAGPAVEGLEAVYPFDPDRDDPAWLGFQQRFAAAYGAKVDSFAALGFDSMNILLESVCRAGLNRGFIRDALYALERYHGVTGDMIFDPNAKNIAPLFLGQVRHGKFVYRRYPLEKPYASLLDRPVSYSGPPVADAGGTPAIGVFGPHAAELAAGWSQPGFRIVGVSSEAAWGKASTELVRVMTDPDVIGVVAMDRAAAHLAGQIAVKTFLSVLALSGDRTLTSTNIPWIFRLGAGHTVSQAIECLSGAARQAGPNRGKIRQYLADNVFQSNGEPK